MLLYRSNLLGADKRVTNYGGGNTSAKVMQTDPLTKQQVEVLWVKGSGGDLGSMKRDGFSTLYMDKLDALKGLYRGLAHEDEMVGYLPHATFDLNPRAASIDTPLHAYLPYKHVDHVHPDAVIAIAASKNSRELTKQIYGDEIGWLPWKRPGFELGLWLEKFARENPKAIGCVLESHGLFTWADDAKTCYERTLDCNQQGHRLVRKRDARQGDLRRARRRTVAAGEAPRDRARSSCRRSAAASARTRRRSGTSTIRRRCWSSSTSKRLGELAAMGTSCPDHFLRTKIRPLVLDLAPDGGNLDAVIAGLDATLETYRAGYRDYYESSKHADSPPMRDPNAVVYLVPGVGQITFAKDKATARIAGEFYVNAINVMRGASTVSEYVGLDRQEAFDIEYWLLEEAKLQRMPKPKSLAGRVAFVTGGAGGIGRATVARLLGEGACVVLADIDAASLESTLADFRASHGADMVRGVVLDVTQEAAVINALAEAAVEYGGLDILVSNAGISSSAPFEDTELSMWQRNMDILATGYFLVSREAFRLLKKQGLGGAMVFVASKNGLAASPGASAYCTAKAAEIHLARCLALEGAPDGIRVNVVNPGRGAARLKDLERRMARAARRRLQDEAGRARRALPPALPPEALGVPRGHRRGDLFPGVRPVGEIDGQHHQRGRGQCPELHPLRMMVGSLCARTKHPSRPRMDVLIGSTACLF